MKNLILFVIISCLPICGFAQERDFVQLNAGGSLPDGGYNIQAGYGRQLKMIEIGTNLNFFSDLPIKSYDGYAYDQNQGWYFSDNKAIGGLSLLSLNLVANVDILYFIQQLNHKHKFKIGGGIGGYISWETHLNPGIADYNQRSVSFNSEYGFQYTLSASYDYALTKSISLGIYFDYLKSIDDYPILGAHIRRYF